MDEKNIFLLDNGDVLELTGKKAVKQNLFILEQFMLIVAELGT